MVPAHNKREFTSMTNQNTVFIGNGYDHTDVEATLINAPLWWHERGLQKTASGYGNKIETRHKVNYQGRDRRVYADCHGNAAHCYIMVKGEKITVR